MTATMTSGLSTLLFRILVLYYHDLYETRGAGKALISGRMDITAR